MLSRIIIAVVAVVAVVATVGVAAGLLVSTTPAEAAKRYGSCSQLRDRFPNGVANTATAARRQVSAGFHRPAVRRSVYRANRRFDRDRDRTACERRRPNPWITMPRNSMLPLDVMDFTGGTSLSVTNFAEVYDTEDVVVTETPVLSDGTRPSGWDGDYYTDAPLTAGTTYNLVLTVRSPRYWDCSIYDANGCSWMDDFTDVLTWRFTYAGNPGVIHEATKVSWKRKY